MRSISSTKRPVVGSVPAKMFPQMYGTCWAATLQFKRDFRLTYATSAAKSEIRPWNCANVTRLWSPSMSLQYSVAPPPTYAPKRSAATARGGRGRDAERRAQRGDAADAREHIRHLRNGAVGEGQTIHVRDPARIAEEVDALPVGTPLRVDVFGAGEMRELPDLAPAPRVDDG